jgi:hypothetical protein
MPSSSTARPSLGLELNVEAERSVLFADRLQAGDVEDFSVDLVEGGWCGSLGPAVADQDVTDE